MCGSCAVPALQFDTRLVLSPYPTRMSASLVRKGLELFKDDLLGEKSNETKKKKKKDPMKMIGTNKQGVKKKLRRLKHQHVKKATVKKQKLKSALDEYEKHKAQGDNTEDNLQFFQQLTKSQQTSSVAVEKILDHNRGRLSKNKPLSPTKNDEGTVFTDRDFEKFEEEYVDDFWS